ncbi:MAG: anion permease, partial [Magnetococcales bacterium]|nr:anion permease [Magnetococcales bacterium]
MPITLLSLLLFSLFFVLMYLEILDRRVAMLSGGAAFVVLGSMLGFYPLYKAVESIYFETLALIFGMSMISATLAKAGFFALWARRIVNYSRGNGWLTFILLSLITYFFSLFVNNLATMVVMLPITLGLCKTARLNPVPVVIALIIASNLGGASTIMGDFPNMIIASAGTLQFLDFIGGMMPACLLELAVLLQKFSTIYRQPRGLSL